MRQKPHARESGRNDAERSYERRARTYRRLNAKSVSFVDNTTYCVPSTL